MNKINSLFRAWQRGLSWPGGLGALLLLVCAVAYFTLLRPAQTQRDRLRSEVTALQENVQPIDAPPSAQQNSSAEQLTSFYSFFPDRQSAPEWLGTIQQAAKKHGLQLEQGEYRAVPQQAGKLIRYSVTLPVKGDYMQLRKFIADVLNKVPHASLEGFSLQRQKATDAMLEAKIRLALYLE
jgi:Tfp pilus assembly protein PilO